MPQTPWKPISTPWCRSAPRRSTCTLARQIWLSPIFAGVSPHVLCDPAGRTLKVFCPELDRLQLQVLGLLGVPPAAYALAGPMTDDVSVARRAESGLRRGNYRSGEVEAEASRPHAHRRGGWRWPGACVGKVELIQS